MLYVNPVLSVPQSRLGGTAGGDPLREKLAAEELEHFFLFTLLQEMRKSIPTGGLFSGGAEKAVFDDMLDDALSGAMAKSGQLGIAALIERQISETAAKAHSLSGQARDTQAAAHNGR